jgi:hypothetical protein
VAWRFGNDYGLLEAVDAHINAVTSRNNQSVYLSLTVLAPIQAIPIAFIKVAMLCHVIHIKRKTALSFEALGWPSCANSRTTFGHV